MIKNGQKALVPGQRLLLLLFATVFLTGCWGRNEVEDLGFVLGIGIDKAGDENSDHLRLTVAVAIPQALAGGGGEVGAGGQGDGPGVLVRFGWGCQVGAGLG